MKIENVDVEDEITVAPQIGKTGLPAVFAGDEVERQAAVGINSENNNIQDRWEKRFTASYPRL